MLLQFGFPGTFEDFIRDGQTDLGTVPADSTRYPSVDVVESDNTYVVLAELPGVSKENLVLKVEDGMLTISGERKPSEVPQNAKVLLNEMRGRQFSRCIQIPKDVEAGQISAELENGLLKIELPKSESMKSKVIPIK